MKILKGLLGFGLGVACLLLVTDYMNAGQASACLGQRMCAEKVLRAGGKNSQNVKVAAIACGAGSVLLLLGAFKND